MIGRFKDIYEMFSRFNWSDAEFQLININYDSVEIELLCGSKIKRIICLGYIGLEGVGFWDEIIVDTISIVENHQMIDSCYNKISESYGGLTITGSEMRNLKSFYLLNMKFIDTVEFKVVASDFRLF